ncbi:hypothetical protein JOF56_011175 [Kibdelosporangium banguiense]|uniref:Uncharacterized protein n=1 Tax=Kibdelosporangium banguiense TaxID=1365924 RepID=A0ABS4U2E4_9PSEU|nr:hypothetical protein [Kibdelosporangium banguiense]MBP2330790.1 hypothetical protein [Kibdelosporangium banguiense]
MAVRDVGQASRSESCQVVGVGAVAPDSLGSVGVLAGLTSPESRYMPASCQRIVNYGPAKKP